MFTLAVDSATSAPVDRTCLSVTSNTTTTSTNPSQCLTYPTPPVTARGEPYQTNRTVFSASANDRHSDVALHTLSIRGVPIPDGSRVVVVAVVSPTEEFRTPIYLVQGGSATWTGLNIDVSKVVGHSLSFFILTPIAASQNDCKIVAHLETVLYNTMVNAEGTVNSPDSKTSLSFATRKNDRRASHVGSRPTMETFCKGR